MMYYDICIALPWASTGHIRYNGARFEHMFTSQIDYDVLMQAANGWGWPYALFMLTAAALPLITPPKTGVRIGIALFILVNIPLALLYFYDLDHAASAPMSWETFLSFAESWAALHGLFSFGAVLYAGWPVCTIIALALMAITYTISKRLMAKESRVNAVSP